MLDDRKYTTVQKFGVSNNIFERHNLSSHLFGQKYSKISNIVKYYYNSKELVSILMYLKMIFFFFWETKLNF